MLIALYMPFCGDEKGCFGRVAFDHRPRRLTPGSYGTNPNVQCSKEIRYEGTRTIVMSCTSSRRDFTTEMAVSGISLTP
jgi:hypothetical protein